MMSTSTPPVPARRSNRGTRNNSSSRLSSREIPRSGGGSLYCSVPMSPEEEAAALEQLVDMFPQYDRADLLAELRSRRSAEAVAESILLGIFPGIPRGGVAAMIDCMI